MTVEAGGNVATLLANRTPFDGILTTPNHLPLILLTQVDLAKFIQGAGGRSGYFWHLLCDNEIGVTLPAAGLSSPSFFGHAGAESE
jgi:hypothetical protein